MAWKRRILKFGVGWLGGCIVLSGLLFAGAAEPRVAGEGSSRSGVFVAFSQDREIRNKMLRAAGSALLEWGKIYSTKASGDAPIILNDKTRSTIPRGGRSVVPLMFETEAGMKVQVDLYDEAAIGSGAFDAGVFAALALHAMHGARPPRAGSAYAEPPGWFIEALAEELRRSREGMPDGLYSALIHSRRPPDLAVFFKQKPQILDATSIVLYRAQAVSLLRILKMADGFKNGFATLLEDPAFSKSEWEPLLEAFPSLGSRADFLKRWTLDIARSSMPPRRASLTVEQSDRELADILKSVGGPEKVAEAARSNGGAYRLRECAVQFFHLEFRAHPLFQPILEEYRNIFTLLSRKPKASVSAQIADLEKIRHLLVKRSKQIADYLNWFEVTQLDAPKSLLQDQTKAPHFLLRHDPYSLFLDSLEERGW